MQSRVVVEVPIKAGDRGQIDGVVVASISRPGRIATLGKRLVTVAYDDLDQLEAAVPDEAPGFTEGSGYGSDDVTIIFDMEHLRTPFPDGREAREMPSAATASGDQSHRLEGSK
jgi:hypothetical protein